MSKVRRVTLLTGSLNVDNYVDKCSKLWITWNELLRESPGHEIAIMVFKAKFAVKGLVCYTFCLDFITLRVVVMRR